MVTGSRYNVLTGLRKSATVRDGEKPGNRSGSRSLSTERGRDDDLTAETRSRPPITVASLVLNGEIRPLRTEQALVQTIADRCRGITETY